jgi:transcriptional regulator with XRE-family HTH domain
MTGTPPPRNDAGTADFPQRSAESAISGSWILPSISPLWSHRSEHLIYWGRWIFPLLEGTCNTFISIADSVDETPSHYVGPNRDPERPDRPQSGGVESDLPETAKAIRDLHLRSGLSWDELARLIGVSRRSVHNWANGAPVSQPNSARLAKAAKAILSADMGSPKLTRSRLLAPSADGSSLYAQTQARTRSEVSRLSVELDLKPDELLDARFPDPSAPDGTEGAG